MFYIPTIVGSTRRDRQTIKVARFVLARLQKRPGVKTELLDLLEYDSPIMEERLHQRDDPPPRLQESETRSAAPILTLGLGAFAIPASLPVSHVQDSFNDDGTPNDVIRFTDPDGLLLELVTSPEELKVQPWPESTVPAKHSIRGFHSVSAALEGYERTAKLLTETLGYQLLREMGNRFRFAAPDGAGPGRTIDLLCMPDSQPGSSRKYYRQLRFQKQRSHERIS